MEGSSLLLLDQSVNGNRMEKLARPKWQVINKCPNFSGKVCVSVCPHTAAQLISLGSPDWSGVEDNINSIIK